MLLSRNGEIMNSPAIRLAARPPQTSPGSVPLWTDDFASLFQILRSEARPQNDSKFTETQTDIAYRLCQQENFAGAIACYHRALKTLPRSPVLLNNLAFLLASSPDASLRNGPEAVQLAEKACQLTHYQMSFLVNTLAAAYAEAGRFDEAIATAQKACAMASGSGELDLLKKYQELLALYLQHQPYGRVAGPNLPATPATNRPPDNAEKLVPAAP
jgi:tetratricopeptide (TPR) repeat protein